MAPKTSDISLSDTASQLSNAIVRTARVLRQDAAAEAGLGAGDDGGAGDHQPRRPADPVGAGRDRAGQAPLDDPDPRPASTARG